MRILLYSPVFYPSVGGLETGVANRAEELRRAGHEVTVVCTTDHDGPEPFAFRVVRKPSPLALLREVRRCDLFFQANVSLKGLWPLLLVRRPWVVSHHSWYRQPDGSLSWRDRLKRWVLRYAAASIAVSEAIAEDLGTPSVVIENLYRDDVFRVLSDTSRDLDFVFVGRLVSDKGCDLLLEALARLKERGLSPGLTLVGTGPEEASLRRLANALGLADQVELVGVQTGEMLCRTLNRHRFMIVPSRYNEPFGTVALEGIACGCTVIGSEGGGLSDAIGPGGWTFSNGDVEALTSLLESALEGRLTPPDPSAVAEHLDRHTRQRVGSAYLGVLSSVAATRSGRRAEPES